MTEDDNDRRKLPWRVEPADGGAMIVNADGKPIAACLIEGSGLSDDESAANAAFIVHAVNAYGRNNGQVSTNG